MSYKPLHVFERAGLYLTVFLTGAAVMVIELLGARMIAPFYGVSLYVWSSLISVALIALAMGYFAGGRWADRPQFRGLFAGRPQCRPSVRRAQHRAAVSPSLGLYFRTWQGFNDFIFRAAGQTIDLNSPTLRAEQVAWLKNRIVAVPPLGTSLFGARGAHQRLLPGGTHVDELTSQLHKFWG